MTHEYIENNEFTGDMQFRDFLKKKRRLLGLNQTDMGRMLNVNQGTISMWELGVTSPAIDQAYKIIKVLGGRLSIENIKDAEPDELIRFCPFGYNPWQE